MGDSGAHLASRGQGDSNGNDEDDDDDPSSTLTTTTTTQCRRLRRHHQLLYSKEPAIAGLPRCRSCCMMGDSGAHLASRRQGASNGNDEDDDDDDPSTAPTMTSAPVLEGTRNCGSPEMQELLHDGGQRGAPRIAHMPSRTSSSWVSASAAQQRPVPPPATPHTSQLAAAAMAAATASAAMAPAAVYPRVTRHGYGYTHGYQGLTRGENPYPSGRYGYVTGTGTGMAKNTHGLPMQCRTLVTLVIHTKAAA